MEKCPYAPEGKRCIDEERRKNSIACQYVAFCIEMACIECELTQKSFKKEICPFFEERIEKDDR